MDVLYIPQLDDGDAGESPTAGRYRILSRTPEDGVVALADRAVTRIEVDSDDPLRLVVPPLVKGAVRDFFVRLVVTSDKAPEIAFSAPSGETLSFEDADEDALKCEIGVNVFSFTECDEGVFFLNRKTVDILQSVEFDPNGGTGGAFVMKYKLGEKYGTLPTVLRDGHSLDGWFTEVSGGTQVKEGDVVKTGVSLLHAHWSVYVDPFVDAICPAKNLTFVSTGTYPWRIDSATGHAAPGSARSCEIPDGGLTALRTSFAGPGTLSFWWKASSEAQFDMLRFLLDGVQRAATSGSTGWQQVTVPVTGAGDHVAQWRYEKDVSLSYGSDCGWVDDVVWTPAGA